MTMRVDARMFAFVPPMVRGAIFNLPPVKRFTNMMLRDLGIPRQVLKYINYPTRFDSRETERALQGLEDQAAQARELRLAPVGLLGAPPRPRPVHRPLAERQGQGLDRADHRRFLRHRPRRGDQGRGRGRAHHRGRAQAGRARRGQGRDREGRAGPASPTAPTWPRCGLRRAGQEGRWPSTRRSTS